ncbi:MAG TPA: hypothetical protein V6D48_19395 [Oculatellaceae cyanobacterium]
MQCRDYVSGKIYLSLEACAIALISLTRDKNPGKLCITNPVM